MYGELADVAFYSHSPDNSVDEFARFTKVQGQPSLPDHLLPKFIEPVPFPHAPASRMHGAGGVHAQAHTSFDRDFIMVAEFSEIEGPRPLIVLPMGSPGSFDLNSFAVKIMAIDYQATLGNTTHEFSVVEDTRVVLEATSEGAHAYVQHLTLYDTQARGFTRPFCMAYITADKRKIMDNMAEMMKYFSKVSTYFKYGNRLQFVEDLKCYLADLNYTKERYHLFQREQSEKVEGDDILDPEQEMFLTISLETIEIAIKETKLILEKIKLLLNNPKLEKKLQAHENNLEASCNSHGSGRGRSHIPPMHQDGYHSDTEVPASPPRFKISSRSSTDDAELAVGGRGHTAPYGGAHSSYCPQLARLDGVRRYDHRLRTIHQLCRWGAKEGLHRLRQILTYFGRDNMAITDEKKERNQLEPRSALLTIGRCVAINFLHNIEFEKKKTLLPLVTATGAIPKRSQENSTSLGLSSSIDSKNSFFSIEDDVFYSSSLGGTYGLSSHYASLNSLYFETKVETSGEESDMENECEEEIESGEPTMHSQDENHDPAFHSLESSPVGSLTGPLAGRGEGDVPGPHGDAEHEGGSEEGSLGSNKSAVSATESTLAESTLAETLPNKHAGSIDSSSSKEGRCQGSEVTEDQRSEGSCKLHPPLIGSSADYLCNFHSNLPGYGILQFVQKYVFASHAIYTLLAGRTLVVMGRQDRKNEVQKLVNSLSLFVPGHLSRYSVIIPWQTSKLCLSDLGRVRLIGLAKPRLLHHILPSTVQPYVSIFDYEDSTLLTTPYQGTFINSLVSRKKLFKSDPAFVAFVHSQLLSLSTKAYLYYHSYCLHSPHDSGASPPSFNWQRRTTGTSFLNKLGLVDGDARIVEYWVELIKRQQVDEFYASKLKGQDRLPPAPIRLDLRRHSQYHT